MSYAFSAKSARISNSLRLAFAYSLIETAAGTAKANGLEPYKYLCYLFEKLLLAMSEDDSGKLLPQNPNPTPTWISGGW